MIGLTAKYSEILCPDIRTKVLIPLSPAGFPWLELNSFFYRMPKHWRRGETDWSWQALFFKIKDDSVSHQINIVVKYSTFVQERKKKKYLIDKKFWDSLEEISGWKYVERIECLGLCIDCFESKSAPGIVRQVLLEPDRFWKKCVVRYKMPNGKIFFKPEKTNKF